MIVGPARYEGGESRWGDRSSARLCFVSRSPLDHVNESHGASQAAANAAGPEVTRSRQPYLSTTDQRPFECQAGRRRNTRRRQRAAPDEARFSPHWPAPPDDDAALQELVQWWTAQVDLAARFGNAVDSAIQYVLDGARSGRFDLRDERVDPDERRSVGTKLQFHVLEEFKLPRLKSPDTKAGDIAFDIKGTVGKNWSIPVEAQCEICLLVQIDTKSRSHQAWVMRTHRKWLHNGDGNGDQKRGISKAAHDAYAVSLYPRTPLPPAPLTLLDEHQLSMVFGRAGQKKRLVHLFSELENVVIGRATILTVCAGRDDPLRRAREARETLKEAGRALLCGAWLPQRALAAALGHNLSGNAWVAVPWRDILDRGALTDDAITSMRQSEPDIETP